jgi:hypothetical protein
VEWLKSMGFINVKHGIISVPQACRDIVSILLILRTVDDAIGSMSALFEQFVSQAAQKMKELDISEPPAVGINRWH